MNNITPKFLCHDIHTGLNISWTNKGWLTEPCCFTENIHKEISNVNKSNWFNSLWPKLRKDNIANKPLDNIICKKCIIPEKLGQKSKRLGELEKRGEVLPNKIVGPKFLEILFDYTCNNACMICRPSLSSLWRKYSNDKKYYNDALSTRNDIKDLIKNLNLSSLDTIQIIGGEPLLTNRHLEFIEELASKGCDLSKIDLWYHTNGSIKVSKDVLNLWKKFNKVFLYFSIDDIEQGFEYQRFPSKWDILNDNLRWYIKNVSPYVYPRMERSISILNIHRLPLLEEWKNKNFLKNNFDYEIYLNDHYVHSLYCLDNISKKHIDFIQNNHPDVFNKHLKQYLKIKKIKPSSAIEQEILNFTLSQDTKRNISIDSYFPEFKNLYTVNQ